MRKFTKLSILLLALLFICNSNAFAAEKLIYNNANSQGQYYKPTAGVESLDFGRSSGGKITSFTFQYVPGTYPGSVKIKFYRGTDESRQGSRVATFNISLTGSAGYIQNKTFNIPQAQQFTLPYGDFGFSVEFTSNTSGIVLASGGSGQENGFLEYYDLIDDWWYYSYPFGSSTWAGFYLKLYADDTPIEPEEKFTVQGCIYNDLKTNGIYDPNDDPGLANWKVFADLNGNGRWDTTDPNAVSQDPNGFYTLELPQAGNYTISAIEMNPTGQPWFFSSPTNGKQQVTVTLNTPVTGINFGYTARMRCDIIDPIGIGIEDYAILSKNWGPTINNDNPADIMPLGGDGKVDMLDLQYLLDYWLRYRK